MKYVSQLDVEQNIDISEISKIQFTKPFDFSFVKQNFTCYCQETGKYVNQMKIDINNFVLNLNLQQMIESKQFFTDFSRQIGQGDNIKESNGLIMEILQKDKTYLKNMEQKYEGQKIINVKNAQIVLINDINEEYIDLFKIKLNMIPFQINQNEFTYMKKMNIQFNVDFYNPYLSIYEPIIENTDITFSDIVNESQKQNYMAIELADKEQVLNINLQCDLIKTMLNLKEQVQNVLFDRPINILERNL